jgi:hypothetical protein
VHSNECTYLSNMFAAIRSKLAFIMFIYYNYKPDHQYTEEMLEEYFVI